MGTSKGEEGLGRVGREAIAERCSGRVCKCCSESVSADTTSSSHHTYMPRPTAYHQEWRVQQRQHIIGATQAVQCSRAEVDRGFRISLRSAVVRLSGKLLVSGGFNQPLGMLCRLMLHFVHALAACPWRVTHIIRNAAVLRCSNSKGQHALVRNV